jgi:hypothetical protein
VSVWAPTSDDLQRGLEALSGEIADAARLHLTITKSVLRKLVRERLDDSLLENRLFSAVLGYTLRSGKLDAFVAASANDRPFRVLIHYSQKTRFDEALCAARDLLRRHKSLDVPTLERAVFGKRSYNTWSSTSHALGRLAYLGLATLDEAGTGHLVSDLF